MAQSAEQEAFELKLQELSEAYGIKYPDIQITQIVELGESLEGVPTGFVYVLVNLVSQHIHAVYETYGNKPNVLVDAKIKYALLSFNGAGIEYSYLLLGLLRIANVEIKNKAILEDYGID